MAAGLPTMVAWVPGVVGVWANRQAAEAKAGRAASARYMLFSLVFGNSSVTVYTVCYHRVVSPD
jgi:hypothetical protein